MAAPLVWTNTRDQTLRELRTEGRSWGSIAALLGISRWAVIDRAQTLDIHRPRPAPVGKDSPVGGRAPLPAGHPVSWSVLTAGTLLQGVEYPYPPLGIEDVPDEIAPDEIALDEIAPDEINWERAA